MSKELVLAKSDLEAAGFSTQLNSNDLVEVVATDIYNKYVDSVLDMTNKADKISKEYSLLMQPELNKFYSEVKNHITGEIGETFFDDESDDDDDVDYGKGVNASFKSTPDIYWPSVKLNKLVIKERDKGTAIETSGISFALPVLKHRNASVKLIITYKDNIEEKIKLNGIEGTVKTSVDKTFIKTVKVPIARFVQLCKKVVAYNEEASALQSFLPKTGLLSVERFTREARVKMNRKILSSQSNEFKGKMEQLFNIKL